MIKKQRGYVSSVEGAFSNICPILVELDPRLVGALSGAGRGACMDLLAWRGVAWLLLYQTDLSFVPDS